MTFYFPDKTRSDWDNWYAWISPNMQSGVSATGAYFVSRDFNDPNVKVDGNKLGI